VKGSLNPKERWGNFMQVLVRVVRSKRFNVETEVQELVVELEVEPEWETLNSAEFESQDREGNILSKLRLEHLNAERMCLVGICSEYADIFYLPGDKLSSTGAAQLLCIAPPRALFVCCT